LTDRKRRLIAIGGLLTGLFIFAVGIMVAHFTNLPKTDSLDNEILPSIPRGWELYTLGQLTAVAGSQVMILAAVYGWLWEKPITWVRAGLASMLGWIELVLFFGIIPSEMLNLAQGPLGWSSRTAFTIPSWLVLNNEVAISFATIKDALVAGYYTNAFVFLIVGIYMAQEWIKKRDEGRPAVVKISPYGRPLTKGDA